MANKMKKCCVCGKKATFAQERLETTFSMGQKQTINKYMINCCSSACYQEHHITSNLNTIHGKLTHYKTLQAIAKTDYDSSSAPTFVKQILFISMIYIYVLNALLKKEYDKASIMMSSKKAQLMDYLDDMKDEEISSKVYAGLLDDLVGFISLCE